MQAKNGFLMKKWRYFEYYKIRLPEKVIALQEAAFYNM